jgi:hypothetical protein
LLPYFHKTSSRLQIPWCLQSPPAGVFIFNLPLIDFYVSHLSLHVSSLMLLVSQQEQSLLEAKICLLWLTALLPHPALYLHWTFDKCYQ